ncbi:putative Obtusifoliol 14-alpha demethylase [Glarea lozoyensis 74030]|uniref:Putative Obtusifoliol 14-alpha demethylase n=1 Tax=Glarea lozoyensis (strain ATCC 74030 / MF5533) TaxID=1104152 RepID=H0EFH0_GLAL7|nr:putative Obtusifoliol 14-alpha demethylase [Glarea lozoyensis 74030]
MRLLSSVRSRLIHSEIDSSEDNRLARPWNRDEDEQHNARARMAQLRAVSLTPAALPCLAVHRNPSIMVFPTTDIQLSRIPLLSLSAYATLASAFIFFFFFRRPAHPLKAPKLLPIFENLPVLGANTKFGIAEGYAVLFGGGPRVKNDEGADVAQEPGFLSYFARRVNHLLRREYLAKTFFKRTIAGGRLFHLFKGLMDDRKITGRREDDALQYLIDMGDDIKSVIQFIVGAVFAGQLNTGINASFMLTYIGSSRYWYDRVRAEVDGVVDKYAPDRSLPLTQRFEAIPIEAWETEFPLLDYCLRDSIRLQLLGTMYRRNIDDGDVKIGNEVIPSGAFITYHFSDVHQDPEIYSEPLKWDPSRYFPDRAEDKKKPLCWVGWGAGRHPCLGTRRLVSKIALEMIILAVVIFRHGVQHSKASACSRYHWERCVSSL